MSSVPDAFSSFLSALELTGATRTNASRQHTELRENLQKRLPTEATFLTGSFARRTAIQPLNDIDMFVVVVPSKLAPTPATPNALLGHIRAALKDSYKGKIVSRQTHSVHIEFSKTGIAYDIVPAIALPNEGYRIPDRDASKWIKTNPKTHQSLSTEANERAGGMLIPLIKALKHANALEGKPARSFHLEALAWNVLTKKPESWLTGLRTLVDGLHANIAAPCPDPAGLGPNIEPDRARVQRSQRWLFATKKSIDTASRADTDAEAHRCLRRVFGPKWPG